MTVSEHVSLDGDPIAQGALAREPAPLDLGADRLDGDPSPALGDLDREAGRGWQRRATHPPLDRNASHWLNRATYAWLPPPVQGRGAVISTSVRERSEAGG